MYLKLILYVSKKELSIPKDSLLNPSGCLSSAKYACAEEVHTAWQGVAIMAMSACSNSKVRIVLLHA